MSSSSKDKIIKEEQETEENSSNKEDYMLKIKDRISEFRDSLNSDINIIDYKNPLKAMAQKLAQSNPVYKPPHYLDHSWRGSELTK